MLVTELVTSGPGLGGTGRTLWDCTDSGPGISGLGGTRRYQTDVRQVAHNPKVVGSNPTPATIEAAGQGRCESTGPLRGTADLNRHAPFPTASPAAVREDWA